MNGQENMRHYAKIYKDELLNKVVPFWEKFSPDLEYGGYFSCLSPEGKVYDTDKFIWLQARQVWTFAKLYLDVEPRDSWREMAFLGAEFLKKYGRDINGNWYFSLNRSGKPLVQPYNIFSDCFAAMAFGKLYEVSKEEEHAQIALDTFQNILKRQKNPKGKYNKIVPATRELQNFALPMILCNLALELEPLLGKGQVDTLTDGISDLILSEFYDTERGLVLENISANGAFIDSFEGRLLNPGHAIEAMWFIMNLGLRKNDTVMISKAEQIMYQQLEHGWDKEYGGIYYFMDVKGHPPQQLEWDQKLWWVHLEALIALAKAYAWGKNENAKAWFQKVHQYSWEHFRDKEHGGEWYGYLNRQGQVLLALKGGKWKGCFHVPRALMEVSKILESVS
ncbi:MAG: AGE family epimerase/isomerase [Flavobacteriaceae bacterium]